MESVVGALQSAIVRAPDVRVFNLSFDAESRLDDLLPRQRAETLKHIEELDNFAFDQDILLVIAAGNAASGVVPNPAYPHHFDDPGWELHSIPRAFNALTCGGSIYRLRAGGLASEVDAPCPFTRVGPGFARSPKPDFCAAAGNTDRNYTPQSGSGVWALSALGEPQEVFGTSYAAPLLAREGAFVFRALQQVCPENTRPFACTAKAVLALTADDVGARCDTTLQPLIKRTLGYGKANVATFRNPVSERARFFWQGLVEHHADVVRVQLPIPKDWVNEADSPELRICVAWDTPVCAAAEAQWSCRDVELTLRPNADGASLRGTHSRVPGYPLFNRSWSLLKAKGPLPDLWTVEIKYTQLATYAAGHIVSDSQRVAFAAEIWDASEEPVQPHSYVQSLPIASTFSRFSSTATWLPQAVTVTTDF